MNLKPETDVESQAGGLSSIMPTKKTRLHISFDLDCSVIPDDRRIRAAVVRAANTLPYATARNIKVDRHGGSPFNGIGCGSCARVSVKEVNGANNYQCTESGVKVKPSSICDRYVSKKTIEQLTTTILNTTR